MRKPTLILLILAIFLMMPVLCLQAEEDEVIDDELIAEGEEEFDPFALPEEEELAEPEEDPFALELEDELAVVGEREWWTGGPILEFFKKGGPFMWPLLLLSVLGVIFIIERLWAYHSVKMNTAEFTIGIKTRIQKGDVRSAIKLCESQKSPIAAVVKSGLLKYGRGREVVENAVATSAVVEASRLERGLAVLASVANIAPLLGFLGTVSGMIASFDVIAREGLTDPGAVAGGISEALITTASGLVIAIPMLAAYNYFTGKVARFTLEMEESSNILIDLLHEIELKQKEQASPQAPKGPVRRDLT